MPVVVEAAEARDVPVEVGAIGAVTPLDVVSVTSRVDGRIERVLFRQGDYVPAGAPLFQLDPRPLEAAVAQAQAALKRDQAQERYAAAEAERYRILYRRQLDSAENYEQRRSAARAARHTVSADRAALRAAKLNAGYALLRAPIAGLAGNLQVTTGNLVKALDTTPLVVLRRIVPIYVAFSVPADRLPEIRRALGDGPLLTLATPRGGGRPLRGALTFLDNTVDMATGTIGLKAIFPNEDRALWPGAFVDVRLRIGTRTNAVVVADRAIQIGQQGSYVFVVRPDRTAELRPVTTGVGWGQEVVIASGVAAGERVVTDGQLGLVTGAHVLLVPALGGAGRGEGAGSP